ncbi:hypothetical protein SFRURICE_012249 [Spodoptera frugiperda]|nr:hypothetical protein SFRURICE_012249 [Spodoptera frugiperda]
MANSKPKAFASMIDLVLSPKLCIGRCGAASPRDARRRRCHRRGACREPPAALHMFKKRTKQYSRALRTPDGYETTTDRLQLDHCGY